MNRTLVVIALLAPLGQGAAQQVPVIQPKITELGTVIDSGGTMPITVALSPSGTLVAYTTSRDLRVLNVSRRSSTVLLSGRADEVTWSRRGDALVFNRPDDPRGGNIGQGAQYFVWTIRVDPTTGRAAGSAQRVSLSPTTGRSPQLSPDGKLIAYPRRDSQRGSSLVVVPATGGAERVLATGFDVRQLRWNADGTSIYYATRKDSMSFDYYVNRIAMSGGAPERVHDASGAQDAPRVTADGRLVFRGPTFLDWSERTLKGMSGTVLATLSFPVDAWSDDASGEYRVIAIREARQRALRLVEIASGASKLLVDMTAEASTMAWFADGQRVAVVVRRNGVFALGIFGVNGRELKNIPLQSAPRFPVTLDSRAHSDLALSPDGRYAAYIGYGRHTLELVDLNTGQQRTLARSQITVTSPVWSNDSRSIRYLRDAAAPLAPTRSVREVTLDGADKLVRMLPSTELPGAWVALIDFDYLSNFGFRASATSHTVVSFDGTPNRVFAFMGGGGQLSPDRTTIAVRAASPTGQSLRRLMLETLRTNSLRSIDLPFDEQVPIAMQWSHDGRSIFIPGSAAQSEANIYSVPIDGSTPRVVVRAKTKEQGSLFSVSPDGKYIAYVEGGPHRATFLSVDFTDGVSRIASTSRRE